MDHNFVISKLIIIKNFKREIIMKKIKINHVIWIIVILLLVAVLNKMYCQDLMSLAFEGEYLPLIAAVVVSVIIFIIKCIDSYNDMKK